MPNAHAWLDVERDPAEVLVAVSRLLGGHDGAERVRHLGIYQARHLDADPLADAERIVSGTFEARIREQVTAEEAQAREAQRRAAEENVRMGFAAQQRRREEIDAARAQERGSYGSGVTHAIDIGGRKTTVTLADGTRVERTTYPAAGNQEGNAS